MSLDQTQDVAHPIDVSLGPGLQLYRFGPLVEEDRTTFRLWAPSLHAAELVIEGQEARAMRRVEDGFFEIAVDEAGQGTRYKFRVGDLEFPDLASRQQDGHTNGWSIVRSIMPPSDRDGPLRPWHETIICEVHVGTVTPEGTFNALRERLEHFRDAGYTCLEIMPINEFPGSRNWGYDGTLIFAPESAYGTPDDLRALVDRAHELGVCMVLDVVYNHFGETHNFVEHYAPEWFSPEVQTPWGPGIDFNQPMVRQFYYENACMWLREYDFDGLRLDSVHEIKTEHRDQFLGDLAKTARGVKDHAKLIIENMENGARWLDRTTVTNEPINFVAQWNDDMHHVLEHIVTGEPKFGYDDPSKDAIADLEKALSDGFVHDGEVDGPTDGHTRGEPASRLPADAFITYVQNHDQIGNRGDASRLADRVGADKLDLLRFLAFLAPQIPLFFMGEEGHLRSKFPFFTDLPEQAAKAKQDDRYKQMAEIFHEEVPKGGLPWPNDAKTMEMAKLPWDDFHKQEVRDALDRFRTLAQWRKEKVWPLTSSINLDTRSYRIGNCLLINWKFQNGTLTMAVNPTDQSADIPCWIDNHPVATGEFSQNGDLLRLGPWSAVAW
jgi:malto-oligosyltrehalose trehalohydrolase